jgi:hypothetical protein
MKVCDVYNHICRRELHILINQNLTNNIAWIHKAQNFYKTTFTNVDNHIKETPKMDQIR